jgi:hypothetical protein
MSKFTPQVMQRIVEAVNRKIVGARCPLCGSLQFTVAEGFVPIPIQNEFPTIFASTSGRSLVAVALVCNQCGNTFLLNLNQLGLGDLVSMESLGK